MGFHWLKTSIVLEVRCWWYNLWTQEVSWFPALAQAGILTNIKHENITPETNMDMVWNRYFLSDIAIWGVCMCTKISGAYVY